MSSLQAEERKALQALLDSDAPTWIESNFCVPDPRNPSTGELLSPGLIQLHPVQEKILRAALIKIGGKFRYSTIVYSTIKKSGKTRLGAAVGSWYAATQGAYNEVYCMANDGKQSSDRILSAVGQSVDLSRTMKWHKTKTKISLPNNTFIEAIPCDPTGSAGANPGMTIWSEMWGYRHEHKERLWSEMTIPPTRWGRAIRWVESYAGYEGESNVLWDLYVLGTQNSYRHPSFPNLPVFINDAANMFCYWDEGVPARRMPWQRGPEGDAYYRQEATINTTAEFKRIHMNQWVQPLNKAMPIEWWDRLKKNIRPLDKTTPVVMGVDAAVSGACCACALVSRHPNPQYKKTHTQVRAVRVWEPPQGGTINLQETIGNTLEEWVKNYNVVEVAYDEYQLVHMMQNYRRQGLATRIYRFGQVTPRYLSDKQLYDMVVTKRISHSGNQVLRQHVDNAMAKTSGEKFRFVTADEGKTKTTRSRVPRPIDALIAVSMANAECMRLILS
jgi:phage terminase large subunit-like protein